MPPCVQTRKAPGLAVKVLPGSVCLLKMEIFALSLPSSLAPMTATQQDRQIAETMRQQWPRLLQFIRRRIPDEAETQELLQDVFAELVGCFRLLKPVEQTAAWLMPALFHLPLITLSQTLGFLLLSRILFGGFLQGGPPDGWARRRKEWQQRMADRLQDLSPEDRGKFRQQMRTRCSMGWIRRTDTAPTEPTAPPPG